MAFDPDAFLLEQDEEEIIPQQPAQTLPQSTGFDPDAFLAEEEEPEFAQPAPAAQPAYQYDPSGFRRKKPVSPEAQKEIGTLEGIANAARNAFDSSRQALDIVGDVTPEEAQNIAKIEFDKQSRKLAPGYDEYQKAEGFDAVLAFAKNPIEVTSNIVAEGLAGSLPALGAGLAAGGVGAAIGAPTGIGAPIGFTAGQVAGTFAGSLATEYGSKILEEMQNEGVDLTKPESIQGFFENEEAVTKARDKAISRGIPVAAFDAISAGIGGKLGRVIGKQFLTKTGEAAAELGVQAGLGGAGAIAGPLAAGEPISGKEVFGEVIGEVGPGAAEIITGRMADRAARVKAEEEKKIKAAAQLSDNLEQNNAPLTAAAVKSTTATTIEQDKLAAQLEEQLDADEIASQVSGQLAVTKEPTAAPPAIKSKAEFAAIYSQVAPEELDAAEAGFTNTLATAATEEARANAQNALEAIKEVKATVTPPAPTVEPTITPAVTPAVPTAQPPITDATQEIIQPEGVRQEPQDRVEVRPTEETGVSDSLLGAARGEEEGQVAPTPTVKEGLTVQPTPIEQPFTTTTGDAEIDAKITKTESMSPDEYLRQAWEATGGKLGVSYEEWLSSNRLTDADRARYSQAMISGEKFPLPYIDKYGGSQDGRNRALAAKEAGIEVIPVGIIEEPSTDVQIQDLRKELSLTKSKIGKARIQERINKLESTLTPTISEIPATSELVGAEPTQPTIREVPEISPIAGAEPAAIVEQEPVAPTPKRIKIYEAKSVPGKPGKYKTEVSEVDYDSLKEGTPFDVAGDDAASTFPSLQEAANMAKFAEESFNQSARGMFFGSKELPASSVPSEVLVGAKPKSKKAKKPEFTRGSVVKVKYGDFELRPPVSDFASRSIVIEDLNGEMRSSAFGNRTGAGGIIAREEIETSPLIQTKTIPAGTARRIYVFDRDAVYGNDFTVYDFAPSQISKTEVIDITPTAPTPVTTPPVTEAVTPVTEAAPTPAGISVGNRIKLGKSPQTYTIEEVIPQSATERELGEQYYSVKNERTGETQVVEARDLRQVKGKGARKMAAATRNEEYMRLAQDQEANREQLQRMVDEAAKKAGYDVGPVWHGSPDFIGNEFDINMRGRRGLSRGGFSFTKDKAAAEAYMQSGFDPSQRLVDEANSLMRELQSRIDNGLDWNGPYNETDVPIFRSDAVDNIDEFQGYLLEIANTLPTDLRLLANEMANRPSPEDYAVNPRLIRAFLQNPKTINVAGRELLLAESPSQIKSADPVTYDDAGNVIPLEERFQPTSLDIRRQAIDTTPEGILITPPDQQYTFNEVFDVAYDMFGGEIPEGFTIVNDSKDKDFEFKAAYIPESGEIIVNLAYLNKNDDIRDAITHELGHYIFGDPEFRAAFDQFIASLSPEARADLDAYVDTAYNKETGEIRLEEKMVRAFVDQFINEEQAPAWRSMLDAIKRFLNKLGFKFNISDRDAISVFTAALDRYKAGEAISREGGTRKIIDDLTAMDAEYLAAVERGDMETAQMMVDEAAKRAGYDGPWFHGGTIRTRGATIPRIPSEGFFLAKEKNIAESYGRIGSTDPYFFALKNPFNPQNPSHVNAGWVKEWIKFWRDEDGWVDRTTGEDISNAEVISMIQGVELYNYESTGSGARWKDFLATARDHHDGFIGYDPTDNSEIAVAFEPSQIKSADLVTYDDAGDVIPLSQRFRPTSPDIRRMAAEPRREQVAGMKIGRIITTPPGITQKTTDIIRTKFFDSTKVSPENTSQAWAYISQFMDETDNNNNKFAGYVNQVTEEELAPEFRKGIKESMGASLFSVELANYAGRLAVQGDTKMLAYMIRNGNKMPTGEFASGVSQSGRVLNAFKKRLSSDISGVAAYETELESNVERLAAVLFGTNTPSKEQIKIAQDALTESETIELGDANQVAADIKEVETRTNKDILKKIDDLISGYDNPKKDQLLLIFANLIRSRDVDGITISYKPTKVSISDRIANLLVKNLANYRDTLVDKAASGLESTFWRTMSSQENKPGLLGELDQAQNNELAKIVKATLIKMKLAGEPPNTKMTDIEKVASILNESKLSEEKRIEADKRIVAEIGRRRQEELSTTNNPDAVNAKYDSILKAWNDSMSRQLNMPVSDSMLQRLVSAEMKEQNIKIRDLVDEADGKVVAEKKQNIINSIIRKIYGVSKESETGIEMDENYDGLKSYLEQTLDNMYALSVEEKNAAYAKRQAQISLRNTAESQAQSIINRLADQLSDTPAFPQKQENEVKAIVQQDLKQIPDMNRKQPWISQLTAKLMRAGVSEAQAQTISDLVWRQHEIKAMDRESKELQTAAEKGSLAVIIDRIKNTSLERQQSPEWKQEVIKEYLRDAGLSSQAAETAAKLYDSVISERIAAAKQKAFEDTLAKAAPWKNYASRNGKLAKDALKKIKEAIRTGVLDPEKNTESIIAALSGWTGFTKEQYQRIVELDTILNDPNQDDITKREAMDALNKIITKAKMPVRFKDALGAYYIGNALMGIPTALVNIASPLGFSIRNLMVDIAKYAKENPAKIPVAFETFLDSMRSWYNQTAYAFKNQIYLNDVVEYLNGQNVLRETFDKGKKQWAEGKYAQGFANMAVGMTQITGRVLSALDQGAISMLENQNITRYAMSALENAKNKVPKNKVVEFANMTLDLKRRVMMESIAAGMDKDRAGVLADLAVKSELRAALSEYGADTQSVLDSAINDALQSVGRNKVITINGIKTQQQKLSDSGMLSYWPIKMLEKASEGVGSEGSGMQIFAKMVYGFALVPARTFHTAAWFSPYGFLRLAIDKYKKNKGYESPYAMSVQTDAQFRQRLTESIAGSIAMLGLFALRSGSSDEDEDKKFKIVITGNGPNATTDKQYYDSWIKKYKPYSIHIVVGDTVIPINIGRGGEALFFPIMLAGALDDYEIKKKQNLTKKEPSDLNVATEMLGSAFFALAQRGPYAAFTEPLFDASKQGRVTENLVSQLGYFGKTFVPVLGASITRNISDFINDPVDRSSIEGALYANTPVVGPWIGTKALNALGQPIRADDWGDKLYKLGVPVVFSFPKNTPENALNELILKQGSGPTLPTRANAQKRFGDVLTDKEFETYVREYGRVMSDKMFKNRTRLANMKAVDYDDELEKYARGYSIDGIKIKGASDSAVLAVKRMRQ